jgi:hypothetical protein
MEITQHNFIKGMNRDVSKNKFPRDSYYYLLNGRVMADDANTLADIINVKGNTEANINDNGLSRSGYQIIGYVTIKDDIILFYAANAATGSDSTTTYSIIDRLNYSGNDAYSREELWNGQGLNFRLDKPIRAVSRYESDEVQKIYWVDNNNNIKFANVGVNISSYDFTQFDILGEHYLKAPEFVRYSSGKLKSGSISYAYRYIKQSGQYSLFTPASTIIPLGRNINLGLSFKDYKGDDIYDPDASYTSNRGVELKISTFGGSPDIYDYIEVISLWYSDEDAVPDIKVIARIALSTVKDTALDYTYYCTDTGDNLFGELTYEEYLSQSIDFSAKDLVMKDNRLFVANIEDRYFDLDEDATWSGKSPGDKWDARAYRFDSTAKCELLNIDQVQSWVVGTYPVTPDYTLNGPSPSYTSVSEEADAINPFNRATADVTEEQNSTGGLQKYQVDGSTIGGSGSNISYIFDYYDNYMASLGSTAGSYRGSIENIEQLGLIKGFQRDEVYRFGIVFFDKKGRQSFVKWIGDIRINDLNDTRAGDTSISYEDSTNVYNSRTTYPFFTISNHPQINGENLEWEIVYVPREEGDKGVVMAGMVQPTYLSPSGRIFPGTRPYTIGEYEVNAGSMFDKTVVNFISPEINYREDEYLNIEFIQIAGGYTPDNHSADNATSRVKEWFITPITDTTDPSNAQHQLLTRKYPACSAIGATYLSRRSIDAFQKSVPPTTDDFEYSVGDKDYSHCTLQNVTGGWHGTCFTCRISSSFVGNAGITQYYYGYGRKDVFESQYGGLSYISRQQNVYIPAFIHKYALSTTGSSPLPSGDTFIQLFEYGNVFACTDANGDLTNSISSTNYTYSDFHLMVCENSLNLNTKLDTSFFREFYNSNVSEVVFINEDTYENTTTGVSWGKMYNYNDAYNKKEDSKKFFPKPAYFSQIENNPTRVRYSDVKIDNTDIDNLIKFRSNNYNDANENYGEINRIVNFQDKVFAFQNNAVSLISINPRVTQQSQDGVNIILGSGSIIDKFNYLTTDIGCQDNSDIVKSLSGMYWLDKNKKKIYTFNGQLESVTDLKNMYTYLKNNIYEDSYFKGTYDIKNSEVIMTITDDNPNYIFTASDLGGGSWSLSGITSTVELPFIPDRVYQIGSGYFTYQGKTSTTYLFDYSHGTNLVASTDYDLSDYITERDNFTLSYSEKLQAFQSFYSFLPSLYIYHNKGFFTTTDNRDLYQHNIGEEYNTFYGTTYPTSLKLITNFGSQIQSEYTNIRFFCEVENELGELQPNECMSNVSLKDATQLSEDIILYPIHLPEEHRGDRYVLDTSGLRIGTDWYSGLTSNTEDLVVYQNQLYRCLTDSQAGPPSIGVNWALAELGNIRKTNNHWMTNLPRFRYDENGLGNNDYIVSNRFRSNWLELTLEFKDMMPGINLYDRRLTLSDIKFVSDPLIF